MKTRIKLSLITIILIIVLCLSWYGFAPYIDAYRVSNNIELSGVKLLMTQTEVEKILGKSSSIGGFGANFYRYDNSNITIAYPIGGLLKSKVNWIEISDSKYSIYGVQVGDPFEKAKAALEKHRFIQDKSDMNSFKRGSARISIYGQSIRVTIEDWTIKGRIY